MSRERRPHYECNHETTICRDCDGSAPATSPWRTFVDDLPMGGCSTWRIHNAHLEAGDPRCENQREAS